MKFTFIVGVAVDCVSLHRSIGILELSRPERNHMDFRSN